MCLEELLMRGSGNRGGKGQNQFSLRLTLFKVHFLSPKVVIGLQLPGKKDCMFEAQYLFEY